MKQGNGGFVIDAHEILKQGVQLPDNLMGSFTGAEDDEDILDASPKNANGVQKTKDCDGEVTQSPGCQRTGVGVINRKSIEQCNSQCIKEHNAQQEELPPF